jgi:phosphoribosyl-ATP pyrophosphohydrolase
MKTFDELFAELAKKWLDKTPGSNSVVMLEKGVHELGKKLVEEAAEVWLAAEYEGREKTAEEISQLLYWAALMMVSQGLRPEDVYSHL